MDRRGFLDAIRLDPDADAPRLVYADWLDENGEATRAALIRYQMAAGSATGLWPIRLEELALPAAPPPGDARFARGFLTSARADSAERVAALDRLAEVEELGTVAADTRRTPPEAWAASAPLRRADRLELWGETLAAPALAEQLPLLECRTLALRGWQWRRFSCPVGALARLRAVSVEEELGDVESLAALLRLGAAPLRSLRVKKAFSLPPDRGLLAGLERLTIDEPVSAGSRADCLAPELVGLRALELCVSGPDWPEWIAAHPRAGFLEELSLTGARPLTSRSLERLGSACPRLRRLRLDLSGFDGDPSRPFRRRVWPKLVDLTLVGPPPSIVEALGRGAFLTALNRLEVHANPDGLWNRATDPVGPLLRGLAAASRLESLTLGGFAWDRKAARAYFAGPSARGLRHLALGRTPLDEADIRELCGDAMPPLDALELPRLWSSSADLADLARARWGSRVNLWWWCG